MKMPEEEQRSGLRRYKGLAGKLLVVFLVGFFLYHIAYVLGIFTTRFIYLGAFKYTSLSIALSLPLVFLFVPATKTAPRDKLPWYDIVLIIASLVGTSYIVYNIESIMLTWGEITTTGLILGIITILIVLEGVRRTLGISAVIIISFIFLYAMFSNYFPGLLHSTGFSFKAMVSQVYLYDTGMFGRFAALWAKVIVLFLLLAGVLQVSGISKLMMDFSLGVAGHLKGGPAKVAVVASGFFGSLAPVGAANVATTGSITIPLMKKTGQTPEFSAAVEAVASSGGQIMPPIMGTLTFVIAEFLQMPYYLVLLAAILPAILYYTCLFLMVHFQSERKRIPTISRSELPSAKLALKKGWHYTIPILVLIFFLLVLHYTPQTSVLYALGALLVVGQFRKDLRLTLKRLLEGIQKALGLVVFLAPIFIAIGILVGSITITGIQVRFPMLLVDLCLGNVFLLVLLAALTCFIMGAGLPIFVTYLVLAVLVAPALVEAGAVPIAAHLFIMYAALTHQLTPPVMPHVFMAAGIAEANVWKTALHSMALGITLFIVPYLFIFNPALLLIGSVSGIAVALVTALVGISMLAAGMQGWLVRSANWLQRVLLIASGIAVMSNVNTLVTLLGIVILVLVLLWQGITPMWVVRKIRRFCSRKPYDSK